MNRRPKVWISEDQILMSIDRTKRFAERKLKQSQELSDKAKEKFGLVEKLNFELMACQGEYERDKIRGKLTSAELSAAAMKEKADIAARSHHRAINATLPRLGEVLAAFRTGTMLPIMDTYKGVVIR